MITKACTRCGVEKPLDAFTRHKLGKFGRRPRCKECTAVENAAYRARTVQKRAAYNAAYREEHREARLAYNREWNKRNRDRTNISVLAWRERNPEKVAAAKRAWRKANPERVALHKRTDALKRGRAKQKGGWYLTTEKVLARIAYYAGRCYYCGCEADTMDHRIPLARGGTHFPSNLVPACRVCNSRKYTRTEREFLRVA